MNNIDEDSEWCSEMISHSDDQDNVIGGGGDGEEQIIKSNKNRKFQHYQSRKHQQQQQNNNGFFTLNCMYFDLEQREFSLYEIRSADLYVKLDLDELNDIFNPNSGRLTLLASKISRVYFMCLFVYFRIAFGVSRVESLHPSERSTSQKDQSDYVERRAIRSRRNE